METHGARYVNPFLPEILSWMRKHDYAVWYRDKSDSVYVRHGALEIGLVDRAQLLAMDVRIALRRLKKSVARRVRGDQGVAVVRSFTTASSRSVTSLTSISAIAFGSRTRVPQGIPSTRLPSRASACAYLSTTHC